MAEALFSRSNVPASPSALARAIASCASAACSFDCASRRCAADSGASSVASRSPFPRASRNPRARSSRTRSPSGKSHGLKRAELARQRQPHVERLLDHAHNLDGGRARGGRRGRALLAAGTAARDGHQRGGGETGDSDESVTSVFDVCICLTVGRDARWRIVRVQRRRHGTRGPLHQRIDGGQHEQRRDGGRRQAADDRAAERRRRFGALAERRAPSASCRRSSRRSSSRIGRMRAAGGVDWPSRSGEAPCCAAPARRR